MNEVPKVGEKYYAHDDGKSADWRRHVVTITDVKTPYEVSQEILDEWKDEVMECDWIYTPNTDFFVFAESSIDAHGKDHIFVRTTRGGWFSMGFLSSSSLGDKI